jgi:hypothetical protein
MMKFVDLETRLGEGSFSPGGDGVDPASPACGLPGFRFQQAGAFHAVEERVEGSGADMVAVMGEFGHHGEAKDGFVESVHEDMDADQTGKQVAMMRLGGQLIRPVLSAIIISKFDGMIRFSR